MEKKVSPISIGTYAKKPPENPACQLAGIYSPFSGTLRLSFCTTVTSALYPDSYRDYSLAPASTIPYFDRPDVRIERFYQRLFFACYKLTPLLKKTSEKTAPPVALDDMKQALQLSTSISKDNLMFRTVRVRGMEIPIAIGRRSASFFLVPIAIGIFAYFFYQEKK